MKSIAIVVSSAFLELTAYAQSEAPPAAVPQTTTLSTTTTTTTMPVLLPPAEPPKKKRFALVGGVQGGLQYYTEGSFLGTNEGVAHGLAPGYHFGLRASFEFFSWLALDGRFSVLHDGGTPTAGGGSATSVGGLAAVRFTAPLPHVRPYALIGYGSYHQSVSGAGTLLIPDTSGAYEFGLGATIPTGRNIEVGLEYKYTHLNGEVLSRNPDIEGGDPSTLSLFVQYRLPI